MPEAAWPASPAPTGRRRKATSLGSRMLLTFKRASGARSPRCLAQAPLGDDMETGRFLMISVLAGWLVAGCGASGQGGSGQGGSGQGGSGPSGNTQVGGPLSTGIPPRPAVDYSCTSDEGCAVRDIGNCCGDYPVCASTGYVPDQAAVTAWCAENQLMSVCGFPDVTRCTCESGSCVSWQGDAKVWPLP
jgi:hypothetical protein